METRNVLLVALFFLFLTNCAVAQHSVIDSLNGVLETNISDKERVDIFNQIAYLEYTDTVLVLEKSRQAIDLATKINYPEGITDAYYNQAWTAKVAGNYPKAIAFAEKAIATARDALYKSGEANAHNDLGLIYDDQGNYPAALEQHLMALKIREEIDDQRGMASSHNNIGNIYESQGDYPAALDQYHQCLAIAENLGGKTLMSLAPVYGNIGFIYKQQANYPEALRQYFKFLSAAEEIDDKYNMGIATTNIGEVYLEQEEYAKAIEYQKRSLELFNEIGAQSSATYPMLGLGKIYLAREQYEKALPYLKEATETAQVLGRNENVRDGAESLAETYASLGRYREAYTMYGLFKSMADSLNNEKTTKKITAQAMQYEFDKKEAIAQAEAEKRALLYQQELDRQGYYTNIATGGGLAMFLIAGLVFRGYRQKQRANKLLSQQKEEIQLQAEEILDQRDKLVEKNNELEASYNNVRMLSEIGQQVNATLSIETVTETVYQNVNKLMDATAFFIGVYNSQNGRMEFRGAMEKGKKLPFFTHAVARNNTLADYCFNRQAEIFIHDMDEEYKKYLSGRRVLEGERMRSIMYFPLTIKGEQRGILSIQSPQPNQYTEYHRSILRNLAVYVSTALENAHQHEQSEGLLLNILPQTTAQELKLTGRATPRTYEKVTILFTDFKGFTQIAENMSGEEVVANLDYCFQAFDKICKKHGLEKIKTIGDSYMCAGGIPIANDSNPVDAVKAAVEMKNFMAQWKSEKMARGEAAWQIRIGLHTGKVVAGVVGKDKFAYDIWGDAVNTASRMESSGEPGKINVSGDTYALIKDQFECVYRGKIKAKNKGEVAMYFVES